VPLQVNRGAGRGSCDDGDQTCADRLPNGNAKVQRQHGGQQDSAPDAGERAQKPGEEAQPDQNGAYHVQETFRVNIFPGLKTGIAALRPE
jgi:hypothetical protein